MNENTTLDSVKRVGTGLAFIIFPSVFVIAFAGHPGLLNPHFLGPEEIILRARGNAFLQLGHALVTLNTGLLVIVALHLMRRMEGYSVAAAGFIGGVLAILGALMLAADKGALCLTMSALDTIPDEEFARMMPGLLVIFAKEGWMVLVWGILLLPIGFGIQAIVLIKAGILPRRQSILFLIGAVFIGTPDGVEIINLCAAILLAIAFVPYGFQIIVNQSNPVLERT